MNWCVKKAYFKDIGIGWIRKRFGASLFEFFAGIGLCWQRESRVDERAKSKQVIFKISRRAQTSSLSNNNVKALK
jgi:hypothetical protein